MHFRTEFLLRDANFGFGNLSNELIKLSLKYRSHRKQLMPKVMELALSENM